MSTLCTFARNEKPTLGVEVELNLVDSRTMALRNGFDDVLAALPTELHGSVKPELMQCYLEINTGHYPMLSDPDVLSPLLMA